MEQTRTEKNRDLLEWYDSLVFAVALFVLVFSFCARLITVNGSSMVPTLENGDRLLIQSVYTPQRGDIVVLDGYIDYGKPLVKRIIGLGGDTIDIDFEKGTVTRNGEVLDEPYIAAPTQLAEGVQFPLTVPEGRVFVMGDNRMNSTDSRSESVGCIDERDILGKVLWRWFPLNKFGSVKS